MASKHMTDTDKIVKEKILKEIDEKKFVNTAKDLLPGFLFPLTLQLLSVKEITYIWMKCENVDFKKEEKIDNDLVKNCNNCSYTHIINKCAAYGKQCNKCGNYNHFWSRCPSQVVNGCLYCGEDHFMRQCLAYSNKCNRCLRLNHFSWKCQIPIIDNCNNCGFRHIASKTACRAINTICSKCHKTGHFVAKCKKR